MDEKQLQQFYEGVNKYLSFKNDISNDATGEDTVKLITQTINKYANSPFIQHCVQVINSISKNDFEFCENLFKIACALVKYRRDPTGHEMVWTPTLLVRVGKGDCKKFTTFICAVLKCKGIKSASKVVNYDQEYGWQHIYAIAFLPNRNKYLVLDPVNHCMFDKEVIHRVGRVNFYDGTKSKLIDMKLSMMGNNPDQNQTFFGIGNAADDVLGDLDEISGRKSNKRRFNQINEIEETYIQGMADMIEGDYEGISGNEDVLIGAKKVKANTQKAQQKAAKKAAKKSPERKAAQKEKRKKIVKVAKKAGFAPTRVAFLALIAAGGALAKHTPIKFNLAAKLAEMWKKDNGKSIVNLWEKFGGKRDALKNAIIKASKQQIQGIDAWDGIGVAASTGLAATVAAASPLVLGVLKLLKDNKVIPAQDAANSASIVEDVTDNVTKPNGSLTDAALTVIKEQAAPLIQDAIKIDDGGDKQAQKVIKETVTPNDQATQTEPAAAKTPEAFSNASSSSDSTQESSDESSSSARSSSSDSTTQTPQAGGFLLTNASSWITGAGTFQLGFNAQFPGYEKIAGFVGGCMFLVGITMFIYKTKIIKS